MPNQPSRTEIVLRLFFERHKHVFLALAILIILLVAFTLFQFRGMDNKTTVTIKTDELKTKEGLFSLFDSCRNSMAEK